mmetsp:Transcript_8451/g.17929  ORF Transcript_8451/g.17929 Transcript_8451/m.17929 type:complete len:277 (-) Transcript_8451:625-1455(-)
MWVRPCLESKWTFGLLTCTSIQQRGGASYFSVITVLRSFVQNVSIIIRERLPNVPYLRSHNPSLHIQLLEHPHIKRKRHIGLRHQPSNLIFPQYHLIQGLPIMVLEHFGRGHVLKLIKLQPIPPLPQMEGPTGNPRHHLPTAQITKVTRISMTQQHPRIPTSHLRHATNVILHRRRRSQHSTALHLPLPIHTMPVFHIFPQRIHPTQFLGKMYRSKVTRGVKVEQCLEGDVRVIQPREEVVGVEMTIDFSLEEVADKVYVFGGGVGFLRAGFEGLG